MNKSIYMILLLLVPAMLLYAGDDLRVSWSPTKTQPTLVPAGVLASLPDSIFQIKNVRAGTDLDNDGKLEFIVPVWWIEDGVNVRSVFVYENTGNDSYEQVWSYRFPGVADQFVTVDVSDLDGDQNLEILAVHVPAPGDSSANLYIFENIGDNSYGINGTEPTLTWDLGSTGRDVVRVAKAADFDNDGKQEVILTSYQTQPSIVIASVSDFLLPVWTTEFQEDSIGALAVDIAAIGVGDLDGNDVPDIILTEGATDALLLIEGTATDTYAMNNVPMLAGKTISVHGIETGDLDENGRDEAYIANLQGSVWVVTATGAISAVDSLDVHRIADTQEQWLEAGLGDLGLGGTDFTIAASNASKAETYRYMGGDVTDPANWESETLIDSLDIKPLVGSPIRVYGLDFAGDMDGDGLSEIVFTRGSTTGGHEAPAIFIFEVIPAQTVDDLALPDSIFQIKNVRAGTDLDNDGKLEFIVPVWWIEDGVNVRSVFVYENTGNDAYEQVWSYRFPGVADQFVTVDVSDLDGDQNLEILAVHVPAPGDSSANLYIFENIGDNSYGINGTEPTLTWDLGSTGRDVVRVAKAADFDNDGKQEVILTSYQTQPSIVIASVSDFLLPVWTVEFQEDSIGALAVDIAAIGVGDLDGNDVPDIVLTEGATDALLLIEGTAADTYAMTNVPMLAGQSVSVHGIETGDLDDNGRDEAYIAALGGSVWGLTVTGAISAVDSLDVHRIAATQEQWLEAGLGDLGLGGTDFTIAGSNASKAVSFRYTSGDVTDPANWESETLIDSLDIKPLVGSPIRVYGLDFAGDMDGDGLPEIVFTRGSTTGGYGAPAIFVVETSSPLTGVADLIGVAPESFVLEQNYPNPFNPKTTIRYAVTKPTNVELIVYDIMGRKVVTLVDEFQKSDVYMLSWDGKNTRGSSIATGMYFYRLTTDFGVITRRMQFIK